MGFCRYRGSTGVTSRVTASTPSQDKANQEKLFEEFQQADNSITKAKGGTGLGLAISRRIIEMHGGRLWVDSSPGNGAIFTFEFHPSSNHQGRDEEAHPGGRGRGGQHADPPRSAGAGYELVEADNGEKALAEAAKQRPDLILMDIQLPIMDGYEATRRLKADPALRSVPIIAITSYALGQDEARARAAGCDDFVAKPYSPVCCWRKSAST